MRRLALIAALGALACASPASQKLWPGENEGALLVRVTMRGDDFFNQFPRRPTSVTFVKLGPDGNPELDFPVVTNFRAGTYLLALNISPGRYIPVSAAFPKAYLRSSVPFGDSLGRSWGVDVAANSISFVGDATIKPSEGPGLKGLLSWSTTAAIEVSSPRLDKSVDDEATALHAARRFLGKTGWADVIDRRLIAIGSPPVPVTKGLLFKKTVALIKADRFSYIDTLHWGKPLAIVGGLEWRAKKNQALVQVSYLQAGTTGYAPQDQYLRYMRDSGSPEDDHALFTVPLVGKTAQAVRYTTYVYPAAKLVGSEVKVYVTETLLVPDQDSYYLIRYRAPRAYFQRFFPAFKEFITYLTFLPKESPN